MTMVGNGDEYIDSRDVNEDIAELEALIDNDSPDDYVLEREELEALIELRDQAKDITDEWDDGTTLIRETYFVDYAQEFFNEVYEVPSGIFHYIDWDKVTEDLSADYSTVQFDGVTYWVRDY